MKTSTTIRTLTRRGIARASAAACLLGAIGPGAIAQQQPNWPTKPIRLVVGFPAGGTTDVMARVVSAPLQKALRQPVIVDNKPGASGNLAVSEVIKASADGYTLMVAPISVQTANPHLFKPALNPERDLQPVVSLGHAQLYLVAKKDLPAKTAKDLVQMAKASPSTLSYGSGGPGTQMHLVGELFKQQAGIDLLHVPYKGTAPALNDVLGGSVPLMFSNLPATMSFIKNGKLVALGVTETARSPAAPDIPTLAEQGIQGVAVTSWYGLLAPKGTPPAVVEQLAKDAADMLAQPDVRERLKAQGMTDAAMKPAAFAAHIRDETAVWAKVIKARNIVAE